MNRTIFIILFGSILLLNLKILYSQEELNQKATRIGIGVGIGKDFAIFDDGELTSLPISYSIVYFPKDVSSKLRIESEIGFWSYFFSRNNRKSSSTNFRLGFGILPTIRKEKIIVYYGIRLGAIFRSNTNKQNNEIEYESKTDLRIGPCIGVEYFLSDHLSFGGEAQLNYILFGQYDKNSDISESTFANSTLISLRWYF